MSADESTTDLHALVTAYATALHYYVDVAVGVRGESSGAAEAVEDPRLEVAAREAALALGRLEDACTEQLGLTADVGMAWVADDLAAEATAGATVLSEGAEDEDDVPADSFHLHFAVVATPGSSEEALDGVLEIVEEAGYEIVTRLEDAGYEVPELGIARGEPEPFGLLADDGDEADGLPPGWGADPGEDEQ
ncbi:MAG: hypothetical protein ACRDYU_07645 [Actinomycetes bacterium]